MERIRVRNTSTGEIGTIIPGDGSSFESDVVSQKVKRQVSPFQYIKNALGNIPPPFLPGPLQPFGALSSLKRMREAEEPIFSPFEKGIKEKLSQTFNVIPSSSFLKRASVNIVGEIPEFIRPSNIIVGKGIGEALPAVLGGIRNIPSFMKKNVLTGPITQELETGASRTSRYAQLKIPRFLRKESKLFGEKALDLMEQNPITWGDVQTSLAKTISELSDVDTSKVISLGKKVSNLNPEAVLNPSDITALRQSLRSSKFSHDLSVAFDNLVSEVKGKVPGLSELYSNYAPTAELKKEAIRKLNIFGGRFETKRGADFFKRAALGKLEGVPEKGIGEKAFLEEVEKRIGPISKGVKEIGGRLQRAEKRPIGIMRAVGRRLLYSR